MIKNMSGQELVAMGELVGGHTTSDFKFETAGWGGGYTSGPNEAIGGISYNPKGWNFTTVNKTYYRQDLETMTYGELSTVYDEVRELNNQGNPGIMGQAIWVENILRTMLLERRLEKFAQLLDLAH